MVNIKEVKSRRDVKEFIEFPLRLYKGNDCFVPPIYADEKKLIKNGGAPEVADSVFYLAERDGKTVGRIQGIIQRQFNELHSVKRVRFNRFDSIDDTEVSRALFSAVEAWGNSFGMTELCGPLGYNDLDREGLLIEGFEENSTFEEQYNYEYYAALVEDFGLSKEVDWLEFEIKAPEKPNEMLKRVAERTLEMNKLHIADTSISKKAYINKYKDQFFEVLDECYSKLYGTVPISDKAKDELVEQFMMILNKEYLIIICDETERMVAFGLCFPSIGDALKKSGGRLTLPAIIKLLCAARNPKCIDMGLVAILPEYRNAAINAVIINKLIECFKNGRLLKAETNLNLETNTAVIAQWKYFSARQHKRRRCYVKNI